MGRSAFTLSQRILAEIPMFVSVLVEIGCSSQAGEVPGGVGSGPELLQQHGEGCGGAGWRISQAPECCGGQGKNLPCWCLKKGEVGSAELLAVEKGGDFHKRRSVVADWVRVSVESESYFRKKRSWVKLV